MIEIRNRFSPPLRRNLDLSQGNLAKESFRDECDINKIMARYAKTGHLPGLIQENPIYGDFSDTPTYMEAVQLVDRAETAFMALPAEVRAECGNEPAVFLERVTDAEWRKKHKDALGDSVVNQTPPSQPAAISNAPKADT